MDEGGGLDKDETEFPPQFTSLTINENIMVKATTHRTDFLVILRLFETFC
jgi:hypothetical protein